MLVLEAPLVEAGLQNLSSQWADLARTAQECPAAELQSGTFYHHHKDTGIHVREINGISIPLHVAGVGGIHDEIMSELGDRELAPINRERAVFTIVGEHPLGISALPLRQIRWL